MKKLLTYFLLVVLLSTITGLHSVVLAEGNESFKLETKEAEEKEENASETAELKIESRFQIDTPQLWENYCYGTSSALTPSNRIFEDGYILSAYYSLFVLHEQFLI